jgi:Secretion system C-terminal sorting domain
MLQQWQGFLSQQICGADWVKKSNGITIGPGVNFEFTESIFEYNGNLFTGAWNGIYLSTDSAENWVVTNITGEGIKARNFVNHNGILYAAKEEVNPGAYKSTDNGFTWEGLTVPFYNGITFLSEPTKLWAGSIDGVWLSIDNGTSWEERNNGLSPDPYSSSIVRVNGILITSLKFGGSGVFRSSNEGLNWEEWGEGLPFLNSIEKLILFEDKIIAATSNGLWQRDTSAVITYSYEQSNSVPKSYHLYQNYPNPLNPTTTFEFSIPEQSYVKLEVFNLLGEKVATLVSEELNAGNNKYEWNAKQLSSGIYYINLTARDFTQTKKLILLK